MHNFCQLPQGSSRGTILAHAADLTARGLFKTAKNRVIFAAGHPQSRCAGPICGIASNLTLAVRTVLPAKVSYSTETRPGAQIKTGLSQRVLCGGWHRSLKHAAEVQTWTHPDPPDPAGPTRTHTTHPDLVHSRSDSTTGAQQIHPRGGIRGGIPAQKHRIWPNHAIPALLCHLPGRTVCPITPPLQEYPT